MWGGFCWCSRLRLSGLGFYGCRYLWLCGCRFRCRWCGGRIAWCAVCLVQQLGCAFDLSTHLLW